MWWCWISIYFVIFCTRNTPNLRRQRSDCIPRSRRFPPMSDFTLTRCETIFDRELQEYKAQDGDEIVIQGYIGEVK